MSILFIHNALTSFVRIDRNLLNEQYELEEYHLKRKSDLRPLRIWKAVKRNDLVFGWFSSWHTFLPFLFAWLQGKPSVLVAGGYDTANIPEAGYGNQRKWFPRLITNTTIRLASRVICNSQYTKKETIAVSGITESKITVVYHGLPQPPAMLPVPEKENIVLNVGNVSQENLLRKGIKPFLDAAWLLPEYRFVQVGKWKDDAAEELQKNLAPNAELRGFVSDEELRQLYAKSRFYVQPSLHEGFGMSVVEAMQYGTIPIVSRLGALPEVINKNGISIAAPSPSEIVTAIKTWEREHSVNGIECQKFVNEKYTLDSRYIGLMNTIKSAL